MCTDRAPVVCGRWAHRGGWGRELIVAGGWGIRAWTGPVQGGLPVCMAELFLLSVPACSNSGACKASVLTPSHPGPQALPQGQDGQARPLPGREKLRAHQSRREASPTRPLSRGKVGRPLAPPAHHIRPCEHK